ncbi:MBL fold metallo-hydrolase [Leptospira ilyithenensis]|uniref:MBL fold metallo-hydrolase n=2 Tax=Leptospira ilyithenensis TaxID=2484901 RepID=A0A4R9LNB8_9LEPT|nr:MBL fold metallo-hydrolase [Leptospira ilyithenensis]
MNFKLFSWFKSHRFYTFVLFSFLAFCLVATCASIGFGAKSVREMKIQNSKNWKEGQFRNPQPLVNDFLGMVFGSFGASEDIRPKDLLPVVYPDPGLFKEDPKTGLRVTWFGHSSALIEIDGYRILTDPIWSNRTSPVSWVGPERWYEPALPMNDLPEIDFVLISHNHYDHLDYETTLALNKKGVKFIVPLAVGEHLSDWGVPEERIIELDWWESHKLSDFEIVATPARHASGRKLIDYDEHLWAGYAILGTKHRVYYSGDTGLFPAMRKIGDEYGPFDLTMIEVGQYDKAWPDWHIGPEQAVIAHKMVKGKQMLPVHWGLFALAFHSWTEPIERALVKAKDLDVKLLTPRPGESIEPDLGRTFVRWWQDVPWKRAAEHPIISSQVD